MKKNLRKLLAVVLVVVMALSFGAIGASAASFTDTASSNYKEAVNVMSGIGVINGMTATTFDPTGSLTREQAAKIVCYMLLGPTNAALIGSASSQTFSDVATSRWSSGYIDYCASLGIIVGNGDGTFNPTGTLTTAAFTKMLLVAAGYNASAEGYVGANWAVNVASDALEAGIYDSNIVISATANCTREQAAQLSFKALSATLVQYTGGSTVTVGGTTITTGATRSNVTAAAGAGFNGVNDSLKQFAEKYFPTLSYAAGVVNGIYGNVWSKAGTAISSVVPVGTVLATKSAGTAFATLTDASNAKYVGFQGDGTISYYLNDAVDAAGINVGTNTKNAAATVGAILRFIDTDGNGKYDVVTGINQTVEILAAAPSTTTSGAVTTVTCGSLSKTSDLITYPTGLVKGDVILWYTNGTHWYVQKANAVNATITSYTDATNTVLLNGASYAVSGLATMPVAFDTYGEVKALIGTAGYTFYTDNYNNIVWVVAPTGAATLTNTYYVTAVNDDTSFGGHTYSAKVIAPNGTASTITVAKTSAGAAYYAAGANLTTAAALTNVGSISTVGYSATFLSGNQDADHAVVANGSLLANYFYTFTKNSDGTYNLTSAAVQERNVTGTSDITTATPDYLAGDSALLATSSTVFLYYNATTKSYDAYTGITAAPSLANGNVYSLADSTNTYAVMVVATSGTPSAAAGTADYIFCTSGATVTLDSLNNNLYTYTCVVNGVTGVSVTSKQTMTAGQLYTSNDKTSGIYNTVAEATAIKSAAVTGVSYSAGTFNVADGSPVAYILSSSAVIYKYDSATNSVSAITPEAAAALTYAGGNDYIYTKAVSTTDASLDYVFIWIA